MNTVLTIYSAERQSGKTLLGINLGVSLLTETQKSVVLVDVGSDETISAAATLKLPAPRLMTAAQDASDVGAHAQSHSSQLDIVTLDAAMFRDTAAAQPFLTALLTALRGMYGYVILDISSHLSPVTDDIIDATDIFLVVVSSLDYDVPISIIGHHHYRVIVNMKGQPPKDGKSHVHAKEYLLPEDTLTIDASRQSGVPFVIQSSSRQISQTIGRLAREIGKKRFGMAFTGGAALALAQVGIMEVFERNRITFDMMTGVSFGALIGGSYAAGIELERIKHHVIEWAQNCRPIAPFDIRRWFRHEFFLDDGLHHLCDALLGNVYFDELAIPLHVVAIDTRSGAGVVFKEGRVIDAVKNSMRIPKLFVPFARTERHLIDGSVISPTPVHPLKQMGANITVAVAVTPTPKESQKFFQQNPRGRLTPDEKAARENYALVAATFDGLMDRLTDEPDDAELVERVAPDIFILPEIRGISWRDFHQVPRLIEMGAAAAEAVIGQIETLRWGE